MSDEFAGGSKPKAARRGMTVAARVFVFILIAAVYAAHQDIWNWKKAAPLVFGFLPPGLAYHAGYSIAVALMMAFLVRIAWPKQLEEQDDQPPS